MYSYLQKIIVLLLESLEKQSHQFVFIIPFYWFKFIFADKAILLSSLDRGIVYEHNLGMLSVRSDVLSLCCVPCAALV